MARRDGVTVAAPLRRSHHPVTTGRADKITDICELRLESGGILIDTHLLMLLLRDVEMQ
jgi:hypothetical protein